MQELLCYQKELKEIYRREFWKQGGEHQYIAHKHLRIEKNLCLNCLKINFQLIKKKKKEDELNKDSQLIIQKTEIKSQSLNSCHVSAPNYDFPRIPLKFIFHIIWT